MISFAFNSRVTFMRSVSMARISHAKIMLIMVATFLVLIDEPVGARALTDLEIRRQLKQLNKPAVKSIKTEGGDVIDCVDIYKQPAFDHPLLKNHTIQMRPTNYDSKETNLSKQLKQSWHKSGRCPEGTIPILRTQKSDLLRAASLERYEKNAAAPAMESAKLDEESENHGGQAKINIWNVYVEPGESSTSSIFVGVKDKPDLINSGWIVSGSLFGDNKTRLYGYWASDNGGCYNLKCPGFVQTNQKISLGAPFSPPQSSYGGDQYVGTWKIYKDIQLDHWWLELEGKLLGYWPGVLFKNMATSANLVQWGGQVWNSAHGGRHSSTQMGNGHFPEEGFKRAAFFSNVSFYNQDNKERTPHRFEGKATHPHCYDISRIEKLVKGPGVSFFYGGPGGPGCDE